MDGHQFLGPARYWYSLEGRLRLALQSDLAARVSRRIDWPLVAVQSNYLYYEEGDFLGLHHDQARCPFTVIALLEARLGKGSCSLIHGQTQRRKVVAVTAGVDLGILA